MPDRLRRSAPVPEIWDCNVKSFEAFVMLDTQWRMVATPAGRGARLIRTGLDYNAADIVLRRLGLPDGAFADLQVMEISALEAFAEAQR